MLCADATGDTPLRLAEELASIHETTVAEMLNVPPATIDRGVQTASLASSHHALDGAGGSRAGAVAPDDGNGNFAGDVQRGYGSEAATARINEAAEARDEL